MMMVMINFANYDCGSTTRSASLRTDMSIFANQLLNVSIHIREVEEVPALFVLANSNYTWHRLLRDDDKGESRKTCKNVLLGPFPQFLDRQIGAKQTLTRHDDKSFFVRIAARLAIRCTVSP